MCRDQRIAQEQPVFLLRNTHIVCNVACFPFMTNERGRCPPRSSTLRIWREIEASPPSQCLCWGLRCILPPKSTMRHPTKIQMDSFKWILVFLGLIVKYNCAGEATEGDRPLDSAEEEEDGVKNTSQRPTLAQGQHRISKMGWARHPQTHPHICAGTKHNMGAGMMMGRQ